MLRYEHKKLLSAIAALDGVPEDHSEFSEWILADRHLRFLRANAESDELVVYASGEYSFVHSVAVPNERLNPLDKLDLLKWSASPFTTIASYVYGGGRDDMWIERNHSRLGCDTLKDASQLVFGRTFEGWSGPDRDYFEVNHEYSHVTDIHWRPEHGAYCQFDRNGDLDPFVSITVREGSSNVGLVSFKWGPLEEYLAVTKMTLVRLFDFTLLRRSHFTAWPESPEENWLDADDIFFRRKVDPGHAAYTRGVQIIRPRRPDATIFEGIKRGWSHERDQRHVEFIAHDWRNRRVTNISTDPAATTNYFQAAENSLPYELSPAFFRPEVLLKYKTDRDKYTVGPRSISCRASWYLEAIDVNEAGQVHAYLCYLRRLPYNELLHWLSYNEAPKGVISQRAFETDFEGEFSSVQDPVGALQNLMRQWSYKAVKWWTLRDDRLVDRVTAPLSASRDEWAESFMDVAKLVIEGFETKAIRAELDASDVSYDSKEQSISLLERCLRRTGEIGDEAQLEGLRTVQLIRTKVKGHVAGEDAERLALQALAQHETFAVHFSRVCSRVVDELRMIEDAFEQR